MNKKLYVANFAEVTNSFFLLYSLSTFSFRNSYFFIRIDSSVKIEVKRFTWLGLLTSPSVRTETKQYRKIVKSFKLEHKKYIGFAVEIGQACRFFLIGRFSARIASVKNHFALKKCI